MTEEKEDEGKSVDFFARPAGIALVLNRAGRVRLPGVGGCRRRPCGGYPVDAIHDCIVDFDAGPSPFYDHLPGAGPALGSMGGVDFHPSRGWTVAAEIRVADGSGSWCSGESGPEIVIGVEFHL